MDKTPRSGSYYGAITLTVSHRTKWWFAIQRINFIGVLFLINIFLSLKQEVNSEGRQGVSLPFYGLKSSSFVILVKMKAVFFKLCIKVMFSVTNNSKK